MATPTASRLQTPHLALVEPEAEALAVATVGVLMNRALTVAVGHQVLEVRWMVPRTEIVLVGMVTLVVVAVGPMMTDLIVGRQAEVMATLGDLVGAQVEATASR